MHSTCPTCLSSSLLPTLRKKMKLRTWGTSWPCVCHMMRLHSASYLVLLVSMSCNSSGQFTYPSVFQTDFFLTHQWLTLEIIQTFMREFIQEVWEIFSSPNLVLESHLLVDVWIYRFIIAVRRGVCWVWHARVHWDAFIYLRCFLHPIFQFSKLNSLLCWGIYRINMWGSLWELGKNTWHRCTQPCVEPCIHRLLLRIHCIKWITFSQLSSMLS